MLLKSYRSFSNVLASVVRLGPLPKCYKAAHLQKTECEAPDLKIEGR